MYRVYFLVIKVEVFTQEHLNCKQRFNNVLDRKETFFDYKKFFSKSQKSHSPNGLTHPLGQKMPNFSLFRFGQNKTRKNAYRLFKEKRNFFHYNNKNFCKSHKSHFSKGVNPCF